MRKLLLSSLLVFILLSCAGKPAMPIYSMAFEQSSSIGSIHLIDRKIVSYELDLTSPGFATLRVKMEDKLQMGNKVVTLPWDFTISLQESKSFKIVR